MYDVLNVGQMKDVLIVFSFFSMVVCLLLRLHISHKLIYKLVNYINRLVDKRNKQVHYTILASFPELSLMSDHHRFHIQLKNIYLIIPSNSLHL